MSLVQCGRKDESMPAVAVSVLQRTSQLTGEEVSTGVGGAKGTDPNRQPCFGVAQDVADFLEGVVRALKGLEWERLGTRARVQPGPHVRPSNHRILHLDCWLQQLALRFCCC